MFINNQYDKYAVSLFPHMMSIHYDGLKLVNMLLVVKATKWLCLFQSDHDLRF